ncbi:MAG: hypothetical protein FWD82_10130 [Defluviitaleaceae bacterium]|nr:hypothetical protein [Defluviitaleaceae bacterium]
MKQPQTNQIFGSFFCVIENGDILTMHLISSTLKTNRRKVVGKQGREAFNANKTPDISPKNAFQVSDSAF